MCSVKTEGHVNSMTYNNNNETLKHYCINNVKALLDIAIVITVYVLHASIHSVKIIALVNDKTPKRATLHDKRQLPVVRVEPTNLLRYRLRAVLSRTAWL